MVGNKFSDFIVLHPDPHTINAESTSLEAYGVDGFYQPFITFLHIYLTYI